MPDAAWLDAVVRLRAAREPAVLVTVATETGRLFAELTTAGCAAGSYALNDFDDVWGAVRHFFSAEAKALDAT